MNIAITGASGHIGANLCRELLREGHQLRVLVNHFTESLEGLEVERIRGSLLDPSSLEQLAEGREIFIHLAASISINGKKELMDINYQGTLNVIEAVRKTGVKRLIHFSSIHALTPFPLDTVLDERRELALKDPLMYSRSKALAEQAVREAAIQGMDAVIINPTSVMGPNDFKPSLIGQAILQLYSGKIPALIPGGYDWVDVRDVVSGTIAAIEKGKKGESYLLSGSFVSLPDLYAMIRSVKREGKLMGEGGTPVPGQSKAQRTIEVKRGGKKNSGKKLPVIPFWLAEIGVPFLKAWAWITRSTPLYTRESVEILKTAHRNISSEKAERELGYHSRPFEETLLETLEWFKENGFLRTES
jgi:dihydroflavonol-4-reductase